MALEDKVPWQAVELTEWPRFRGNSSVDLFAGRSPALDSQQVVSMRHLIRAARADGLSLTAWEFLLCRERQTLVLIPCRRLFTFQSITSDTASKEPVCQCCPWRGESLSRSVLIPELSAHAFSHRAGHQVRRTLLGGRSQLPSPAKPCPTQPLLALHRQWQL